MPVSYPSDGGSRLVFEGRCVPEEADALLDWLRVAAAPEADLAACSDLHTALAQLLFAARVRLAALPADPLLAACLAGAAPGAPHQIVAEPSKARRRRRGAKDMIKTKQVSK